MRVGGFLEVLAGHLAFTAFSEKRGGTPKFCEKLPSFSPMRFSRSDHEHSFLGLCFICSPGFLPFCLGKQRRKGKLQEGRKHWATGNPTCSGRDPPSLWLLWSEGCEPEGPGVCLCLNCCFPFPHLLLVDAVRVQLLRLVAELACSCPALVAILPLLYVLVVWNQAVCQLEGLE